jgi:hypothetical protein
MPGEGGEPPSPSCHLEQPDQEQDDDDKQNNSASDVHVPSLLGFESVNELLTIGVTAQSALRFVRESSTPTTWRAVTVRHAARVP